MPNKTLIELNKSWVCEHLFDVTDEDMAWVLLQEPGFIGFGVVTKDDICFPPGITPDWILTSDLRLFGKKGEWHVWRDWDGKHYARLLKLDDLPDHLTEYHVLWGTEVKCKEFPWIKLSEERGTEIWLPLQGQVEKKGLPLRLKLKQVVGYDDKGDNSNHLAGIVDAVLVELVDQSCQKVLKPSCSESEAAEGTADCSNGDSPDTNSDL